MKTSKITYITGDGNFKDLIVFDLTLENGDVGKIYRKPESSLLKEGQEINYNLSDKGTIKLVYQQESFLDDKMTKSEWNDRDIHKEQRADVKQLYIIRQSCLKSSIDFCNINGGDIQKVLEVAEILINFVETGDTLEKSNTKKISKKQIDKLNKSVEDKIEANDLPF